MLRENRGPPPTIAWGPRLRPGFSLVELLVVIGIIGLLIAILLPVLSKAREQAKMVACASNQRQVLLAFAMYVSENKGRTPIFPPIGYDVPGINGTPNDPYAHSLAYYMDSTKNQGAGVIRYDQGAFWRYLSAHVPRPANAQDKAVLPPPDALYRVFNCPTDTDFREVGRNGGFDPRAAFLRNFSYTWNASFWPGDPYLDDRKGNAYGNDKSAVSSITQIVEGSHKIILEEEARPNDGWSYIGFNNSGSGDDLPATRHNKRANYGFADGHVEQFAPADLGYSSDKNAQISDRQRAAFYFHLKSNAAFQ